MDKILLGFLALICATTAAAEGLEQDARLALRFSSSFGGDHPSPFVLQFGSTMALPTELRPFHQGDALPVSGISYSSEVGLAPVLFGLVSAPKHQTLNAEEEGSGSYWGWIAAGVAVVAGVVATSASGNDGSEDDDGGPERGDCVGFETGVGGGGVVDPNNGSVDPDQVDAGGCTGL